MAAYRFLGDSATFGLPDGTALQLNSFGQEVDLDPALVETHPSVPLITAEKFAEYKFTDQEIEDHPSASALADGDPAFLEKRLNAVMDWFNANHPAAKPAPVVDPSPVLADNPVTPEQVADLQKIASTPNPVQPKTDTTPNPAPAVPPVKPAPVEQANTAGQHTDQEKS